MSDVEKARKLSLAATRARDALWEAEPPEGWEGTVDEIVGDLDHLRAKMRELFEAGGVEK
jgi:hypothetical protein